MDAKFIIFKLGNDDYAVNILSIISIENVFEIVKVHKAPEYLKGIMNLRGDVIPVIDTRYALCFEKSDDLSNGNVLLAEKSGQRYAFYADEIVEIFSPVDEDVVELPGIFKGPLTEYAEGVLKKGDRLIVRISLDKILTAAEDGVIEKIIRDV